MLPGEWLFRDFAIFVHGDVNFFISTVMVIAALMLWKREGHRLPNMVATMGLALLATVLLKIAIAQPRLCSFVESFHVACPPDFGLPSAHSAVVFALLVSAIGLRTFPFYFIWALLISLSRFYLGVHSEVDIGAGFAVAFFCLLIVERMRIATPIFGSGRGAVSPSLYTAARAKDEVSRKLVQMLIGLAVLSYASLLSPSDAALPVLYVMACGTIVFHLKFHRVSIPQVDSLLLWLERPNVPSGFGAMAFFAGLLLALTLVTSPTLALVAVYLMSVSDSMAAIFGMRGLHPLPYNKKKTFEGTGAFLISGLPVFLIGGLPALVVLVLAAAVESLDLGVDDNMLIPLCAALVVRLT